MKRKGTGLEEDFLVKVKGMMLLCQIKSNLPTRVPYRPRICSRQSAAHMKTLLRLIAFATCGSVVSAFVSTHCGSRDVSTLELALHRRAFAVGWVTTMVTQTTATITTTTTAPSLASAADIDYAKVQDLLGSQESTQPYVKSGQRPTYLVEPTDEFRENERKASDFKRMELQKKQKFQSFLEQLQDEMNETSLLADLDGMRKMVREYGGLPLGISKESLVKTVRARKRKKNWSTQVEIA